MTKKYPRHTQKHARFIACLLLPVLAWVAAPASAATVRISADVWGVVRDAGSDGTFDSILPTSSIFSTNAGSYINRGAWEFDLSELPTISTITSINLSMFLTSASLGRPEHDIYQYVGNGVLGIDDADAGSFVASSSGGTTGPIDVMDFVLDTATLAAGFAGFNARLAGEGSDFFINKEWQNPNSDRFGNGRPWLVVEYSTDPPPSAVPVPAAVWLFGTALIGLAGVARKRRRP